MRPHLLFFLYRAVTALISPLIPFYLRRRARRGREDAARLPERLGITTMPRPEGKLVWLHAASVGEANSVLPLIEALRRERPRLTLLLTTGTVTSARLMAQRLPEGVIHQFVPVDTPRAAARFVAHWRPQMALWAESELWPNLLGATHHAGCRMSLINARMSERSFHSWRRFPGMIRAMLGRFECILAQSEADAARFKALGAVRVECLGNLKYDGALLTADAQGLIEMERQMQGRPRWLAASIHPGEDEAVAGVHRCLRAQFPDLLTVIVPRHPARGAAMHSVFSQEGSTAALRSRGETILRETDIYIADTLGELGLFYRLCNVAFIGGSLVPHGGQNPLEAARLGCAILFGPHMFNFVDMAEGLLAARAARGVADEEELAEAVWELLTNTQKAAGMSARGSAWAIDRGGVSERVLTRILPLVDEA